jgi:hypothetical protein
MIRATVFGLIGTLALAAAPAAAQVHVSARADFYVPAPGVFVVFSVPTLPDAVVVDSAPYGTIVLEQRTRRGRTNTVRMNLRYPHRHRVRGVVVNDYVWVNGRRCLASDAFGSYYEPPPRHRHHRHTRVAGHSHHNHYHGGHSGYATVVYRDRHGHRHDGKRYRKRDHHRHDRARDRHDDRRRDSDRDRRARADRDSCHEDGHPGRGHAYGKCKNGDRKAQREADKERRKADKEMDKERRKAEREMEKERRKAEKEAEREARKAEKRNDKKNKDKGRRGGGNGRGKKNDDKNKERGRKRV